MIRWGKRSHRGTTEFCSAQCFSVIHICLQVQNSRAALGLAKALQWTLLSRAKHMLWSLSSSLPISSPCTVFYAIPYIFTMENEISPMNSMEQNVAILSCIENKWDGIPPPVLPATFITVLFEAQFRPCWGVLSLSSCAEAYPFPSFDWWASIIHAIPVFITKLWSFLLSHLEWLYVLITCFSDCKLPLWSAPSATWFSNLFFFNLKILPLHWIFVSSKINLSLAFRHTFWVSSLCISCSVVYVFTVENEISAMNKPIMQTQFVFFLIESFYSYIGNPSLSWFQPLEEDCCSY